MTVLVVGASGDLAKKKTYPALYQLFKAQLLPAQAAIWGFARSKKTSEELRQHLRPYLLKNKTDDDDEARQVDAFLNRCYYRAGKSYGDWEVLRDIFHEQVTEQAEPLHNLLVYLAIPPYVFAESAQAVRLALEEHRTAATNGPPVANSSNDQEPFLPGFTRVVLEKPFGMDTDSCRELLQSLQDQQWKESSLYRIDHYLGKEMVQNLLTLRRSNPWIHALWNKQHIQAVHIVFKEDFGCQGRGGYFDPYGIVRDILQNHLLQVLMLIAMDLPSASGRGDSNPSVMGIAEKLLSFTLMKKESEDKKDSGGNDLVAQQQESIRNAKVHVLDNMPPIVLEDCLLGQYRGYKDDPTIENSETITPTYACMRCHVNTPTWQGVPFVLEAGKALDERLCEIRMVFKNGEEDDGQSSKTATLPNALVLRLSPRPSVFLSTHLKTPGYSQTPISTNMGIEYAYDSSLPEPYTRLLLDVLRGQNASFVRNDELLKSWEIFTPVLHRMERNHVQPSLYDQDTPGPMPEREEFLKKHLGISSSACNKASWSLAPSGAVATTSNL